MILDAETIQRRKKIQVRRTFCRNTVFIWSAFQKLLFASLPRTDFKMLLSIFLSKCFPSSESFEISLPKEVWVYIWSFLDFNTRQKICTLVSKGWLYEIRNSTTLSSEMILRLKNRNIRDINNALFRWPKLKVLQLSDCHSDYCNCKCAHLSKLVSHWEKSKEFPLTIEMFGINLTEHALLRKIVVHKSMPLVELRHWGETNKVWFDPQNWIPANLDNIINLKINADSIPSHFEILKTPKVLMNVESLHISGKRGMVVDKLDSELFSNLQSFILGLKKLKKVVIEVKVDITDFLDFLHSFANVKGIQQFCLTVYIVHDHIAIEYAEGVFKEALKMVEKSFSTESTSVAIVDCQYDFKLSKKFNEEPELYGYVDSDNEELTENVENSSVEKFEDHDKNDNFVTSRIIRFMNFLSCPIVWLMSTLIDNLK